MRAEDRKSFVETVLGFAELKGKSLSAPALELYWRSMQHWELVDFLAAAQQLLRTSDWMPTPKEFEDLRKAGRPTAGEAWLTARNAIRGAGWQEIEGSRFSCGNELIDRAVQAIGGYRAIGMCESEKLHFLEHRFAEHYGVMQDADDVRAAAPQIAHEYSTLRLSAPAGIRDLLARRTPQDEPS